MRLLQQLPQSRYGSKHKYATLVAYLVFPQGQCYVTAGAAAGGVSGVVRACWRIAAMPMRPPIPIDSTAVLGTSISAPFSFSPSYSIFIARRCSAVGLDEYDPEA